MLVFISFNSERGIMMNTAIILAGGVGSRMGADRPKKFLMAMGLIMLFMTIVYIVPKDLRRDRRLHRS